MYVFVRGNYTDAILSSYWILLNTHAPFVSVGSGRVVDNNGMWCDTCPA